MPNVVWLRVVVTTSESLVVVLISSVVSSVDVPVQDNFEVLASLGVLREETSVLLDDRVDEIGADESWEPGVDGLKDEAVVDRDCGPGHSDTRQRINDQFDTVLRVGNNRGKRHPQYVLEPNRGTTDIQAREDSHGVKRSVTSMQPPRSLPK